MMNLRENQYPVAKSDKIISNVCIFEVFGVSVNPEVCEILSICGIETHVDGCADDADEDLDKEDLDDEFADKYFECALLRTCFVEVVHDLRLVSDFDKQSEIWWMPSQASKQRMGG